MRLVIDETLEGKKYGARTILKVLPYETGKSHMAEVQCDCGGIRTIAVAPLLHGKATICQKCRMKNDKLSKKNGF